MQRVSWNFVFNWLEPFFKNYSSSVCHIQQVAIMQNLKVEIGLMYK